MRYLWAWWLMKTQRILLKRLAISTEMGWHEDTARHRREFIRLQAKIDACLNR